MKGASFHTWAFTLLEKAAFDRTERERRSIDDLAKIWPPRGLELEHVPALGLDVGVDDYEEAGLNGLARFVVRAMNLLFPRTDPNARWASPDEARGALRDIFGSRLVSQVKWEDPTSDGALVRLVTQGLGAHMLTRAGDGVFEVDLDFLSRFRVRPGFVQPGARLRLSGSSATTLTPESIRWARGEHRPGHAQWELAKLAFRVAVGIVGTVRDHAVKTHFLSANSAVVATRTKLPPSHPVRSLLRAFQYRTPAINSGALVTLIPKRAIFHRLLPFEWEGLSALYAHSKADYRFRTLPAELEASGTLPSQLAGMPYTEDALDLWRLVHTLVTEYLDAVGVPAKPDEDRDLVAFHGELARLMPRTAGLPSIGTREALADLLARLVFDATGGHEQVGGAIGDYLEDIRFVVPAMREGASFEECLPSRNTMIQGTMLGVLTNFHMPGIRSDFSALVPEAGRAAVGRWRAGLDALHAEVVRRNAARAQPHITFDPERLEISVSI